MYDAYSTMSFERSDTGVLTVTFERSAKLNSMNADFHRELSTVFADIARDRATKTVVLTGAGRAFSAGGDLTWIQQDVRQDPETAFYEAKKITNDLLDVPQPVVAAVNGSAAGYGLTLALLCDFSFVAEDAMLSDPHVVVGLVAGDGGAMTWPFLVGMARAKRYLLTGDPVTGALAADWGLVTDAYPSEQVLQRAIEMAERLVALPVDAVQGTKRTLNVLLRGAASMTIDVGLSAERVSLASREHIEIIDTLVEQRNRKNDAKR